jgi:hypothetical protein
MKYSLNAQGQNTSPDKNAGTRKRRYACAAKCDAQMSVVHKQKHELHSSRG